MSNEAKKVEWFEGRDELDAELKAHGLYSLVAESDGSFWAVVQYDGPHSTIIMAAIGGERGKTSPYVALVEAVGEAVSRKSEIKENA